MNFIRWAVIAALQFAALGAGLAAFVALFFGFLAGLAWQWIALGALMIGYVYACDTTMKHLKAREDNPWLVVGVGLVIAALIALAAWKFLK